MAVILNIDTSGENASICISRNEEILAGKISTDQKNHASFIQPAIHALFAEAGLSLHVPDAIAVTGGPGSYTGLRVGLSTAKGLCYALQKPLILINTLEVMALACITACSNPLSPFFNTYSQQASTLYCPMMDARRMEVFTALYNKELSIVENTHALILDQESFQNVLEKHPVIFSGSGAEKCSNIIKNANAIFSAVQSGATTLAVLAARAFAQKTFANLAYAEPFYVKEFFTTQKHI